MPVPLSFNPADRLFSDDDLREMFGNAIQYGKEMGFVFDASVDQTVMSGLRKNYGINIILPQEIGIQDEASDFRVLLAATERGCILVAVNSHFRSIFKRLEEVEGAHHAGLIWVKSEEAKRNPQKVRAVILKIFEAYYDQPDFLENKLQEV